VGRGPGRKESGTWPRKEASALIPAIIEIRDRHVPRDDGVLPLPPFDSPNHELPRRPFGTSREKVRCTRDATVGSDHETYRDS